MLKGYPQSNSSTGKTSQVRAAARNNYTPQISAAESRTSNRLL